MRFLLSDLIVYGVGCLVLYGVWQLVGHRLDQCPLLYADWWIVADIAGYIPWLLFGMIFTMEKIKNGGIRFQFYKTNCHVASVVLNSSELASSTKKHCSDSIQVNTGRISR